ncbi:MAG TPA: hypothetical protein VD908_14060, partial [Cytophagales bacterium]|nr:hypothetical protein [Cytophagales bacterium]
MTRAELFDFIEKIDDPKADYSKILSNLHYTHYFLMDKYKKLLQPYGLTSVQVNVLSIIVFHYPQAISLEEIKVMVLEPGSDVSRTVVRLANKGFIQKVIDPGNRRKRSIVSTEKGVKTIE